MSEAGDAPPWLLIWLIWALLNIATFAAFGIDKARARRGEWRISEGNLLLMALIGGTSGAYLGRRYFRHKTRKRGFSSILHLITLGQVAFLALTVMRP